MRGERESFSLAGHLCHLSALLEGLLHVTSHVESTFGVIVSLALEESTETVNGFGELDELTGLTGEDFTHEEWLGEESLDLSGTGDGELILFGELVHTENGDNILERLVILEELLNTTSSVVVNVSDDGRVEHSGGGIEGIDGGIDTKLGQGSGEHSGGVQVSEGGGGGGISQIISGHVDGLHGGNGTLLGGGNTLLEGTEIGSEGGLISDGRGNTTEEGRHLRASLGESEDVVDEKKHILVLLVSEVLSNGKTGEADTGTSAGGLVHLTVHKGGLGTLLVDLDHTRLDHFVVEIVSFSGSLTDTGED